jgi:hypothetical protein
MFRKKLKTMNLCARMIQQQIRTFLTKTHLSLRRVFKARVMPIVEGLDMT